MRYKRDLIQTAGVKYGVIEGITDIATSPPDAASQKVVGDNIMLANRKIALNARKAGITIYAATITPFSSTAVGNPAREATMQRINKWIMRGGSGSLNGVIDFATVLENKTNSSYLATPYDSGDHVQPDPTGYQATADMVPLRMFQNITAATISSAASLPTSTAQSTTITTTTTPLSSTTTNDSTGLASIGNFQSSATLDDAQSTSTSSIFKSSIARSAFEGSTAENSGTYMTVRT